MADVSSASADKSKAACNFITQTIKGLKELNTSVCDNSDASEKPPGPKVEENPAAPKSDAPAMTKESIEEWLKTKAGIAGNEFLQGATVEANADGSFNIKSADGTKTYIITGQMVLDNEKDKIAAALDPASTTEIPTTMKGGRRGKRSARKGRKSSKGGRRSRKGKGKRKGKKSRRGGRRSRISRH